MTCRCAAALRQILKTFPSAKLTFHFIKLLETFSVTNLTFHFIKLSCVLILAFHILKLSGYHNINIYII